MAKLKRRGVATGDRGVALVTFAISLVALLAVSGLVIDGSRAYAERRQMQNAADAAAMAATRQLNDVRDTLLSGASTDESTIYQVALDTAMTNGADSGADFTCRIVDETGADLGACPQTDVAALPGGNQNAVGVSVTTHDTEGTFFIRVIGQTSFKARADATAQIQALRSVSGSDTPFMICGANREPSEDTVGAPPLVIPNGDQWAVNPAAVWTSGGSAPAGYGLTGGPWYLIHGPNSSNVPGCGSGSQGFKGWVDQNGEFNLLDWWDSQTGNRAGPTRSILLDPSSCANGSLDGCILIVPICVDGQGNGNSTQLYCVKFGAFKIEDTGGGNSGNKHHVALLGDAEEIVGSGAGGGAPDLNELRVIKLTE